MGEIKGTLACLAVGSYRLSVPLEQASLAATWLRDLSDGYVSFNLDGQPDHSTRRLPGPVVVMETDSSTDKVGADS